MNQLKIKEHEIEFSRAQKKSKETSDNSTPSPSVLMQEIIRKHFYTTEI